MQAAALRYEEMAAATGASFRTVDRQLVRARAALRAPSQPDRARTCRCSVSSQAGVGAGSDGPFEDVAECGEVRVDAALDGLYGQAFDEARAAA
jgi:hypothetical protein